MEMKHVLLATGFLLAALFNQPVTYGDDLASRPDPF
jgi:hypothetical protein